MITTPILQILWSHRRSFVVVMCLTFITLAFLIFMRPNGVTVRTSIDIGSAIVGGKQETFDITEGVARRISVIYGPVALLNMANKGTSKVILTALERPVLESIGRFVVIGSPIDPSFEKEAMEFQEAVAELVIKGIAARSYALRENNATRIVLTNKVADNLEQQIRENQNEINRLGALIDDLRALFEKKQEALAALYQHSGTPLAAGDSTSLEARIRELQEQLSSQATLAANLTAERTSFYRDLAATRRLRDAQGSAIAEAQFEKNSFNDAHISQLATVSPVTQTSRLVLLLLAFAVSVLAGFGTVVMAYNRGVRNT